MLAVSATAPRYSPIDPSVSSTQPPARRRCSDEDGNDRSGAAAPRRNPLVAAMMQALGSLLPSKPPAAAADAAPVTTDQSTTAAAPRADLKEAAMAFAHELFDALRSARSGGNPGEGTGRAQGHHHHHHGHGDGYGDLAQRLESLAAQVDAPANATQPAASATPAMSATALSASLTTASLTSTIDSATGSTTTSVSLTTVSLSLEQQNVAAPAEAAKESPLLSAFRKLFDALQPTASADAAKPDAASGLAGFLRQLAQSLRSGRDEASASVPTQGSLLSVAA